jgi:hypothetical protein
MRSVAAGGAALLAAFAALSVLVSACSSAGTSGTGGDASTALDGSGVNSDGSDASASTADGAMGDGSLSDAPAPFDGNAIDGSPLCTAPPLSALGVVDTQVNQPYPVNTAMGGTIPPNTYFASANTFYQGSTFTAGTSRQMQVVIDANTLQFVSSTNGGAVDFQAFGFKYVAANAHVAPTKLQLTGVCPSAASGTVVFFGYTFAGNTLTLYDDAQKRVQTFSKE